jgi:hypothetical protein
VNPDTTTTSDLLRAWERAVYTYRGMSDVLRGTEPAMSWEDDAYLHTRIELACRYMSRVGNELRRRGYWLSPDGVWSTQAYRQTYGAR